MQNISVIDTIFPPSTRTLGKSFGLAISAAIIVALFAKVTIPMIPVPMTLQNFAMMMVGLLFPWRLAVGTVVTYISMAAIGLPVLAGINSGIPSILGPTSGYIFGYIPMVLLISCLAGLGARHLFITRFIVVTMGSAILFISGVTVLTRFVGFDMALRTGFYPFIMGDLIKILIACLLAGMIAKKFKKKA